MAVFVQQLATGISIGSIYALLAVGYALVYSVFNFSNFGFGPTMMIGCYAAMFVILRLNFPLYLSFLVAMAAAGAVAVLTELAIYRPMRRKNVLKIYLMIASLGLNTFVPNFVIQTISGNIEAFPSDWAKKVVELFDGAIRVPRSDIVAAGLSILAMILLWIFLYRTRTGLGIRASSFDVRTASLMGINVNFVALAVFMLSGACAGLAGCFYGMKYSVYPNMGDIATKGFVAATVGGLGSLPGAVLCGFILGILETMISGYGTTTYRDLVAYGMLVLVLIFMPNGLLGKKNTDKI